jgi:hypothetical protein
MVVRVRLPEMSIFPSSYGTDGICLRLPIMGLNFDMTLSQPRVRSYTWQDRARVVAPPLLALLICNRWVAHMIKKKALKS